MCWARPKAHPSPAHLSLAQPGPDAGPEVGFGWASDMRKPEAWA